METNFFFKTEILKLVIKLTFVQWNPENVVYKVL